MGNVVRTEVENVLLREMSQEDTQFLVSGSIDESLIDDYESEPESLFEPYDDDF